VDTSFRQAAHRAPKSQSLACASSTVGHRLFKRPQVRAEIEQDSAESLPSSSYLRYPELPLPIASNPQRGSNISVIRLSRRSFYLSNDLTMSRRYTFDELKHLRNSPLCIKPTSLPPAPDWMG
jgi:hypothetical protein